MEFFDWLADKTNSELVLMYQRLVGPVPDTFLTPTTRYAFGLQIWGAM
jgi:hypothetical protein